MPLNVREVVGAKPPSVRLRPEKVESTRASVRRAYFIAPLFTLTMIIVGALEMYVFGLPYYAEALWLVGLVGAGFPVVWRTLRAAMEGKYATDVVASLSIVTAAIINQPLAGLVIVLKREAKRWRDSPNDVHPPLYASWRKRHHESRIYSPAPVALWTSL